MAVIKANGYGHGLQRVALKLAQSGCDAFAVARLDEALVLRAAGVELPTLILEGFTTADELNTISRDKFQVVIHSEYQVKLLEQLQRPSSITVWLKIDTGMHRMGVPPAQSRELWQRLSACSSVTDIRLMTHFASADERSSTQTAEQIGCFEMAIKGLVGERALANSAAILGWPESHTEWVRPGVMLYGIAPLVKHQALSMALSP